MKYYPTDETGGEKVFRKITASLRGMQNLPVFEAKKWHSKKPKMT